MRGPVTSINVRRNERSPCGGGQNYKAYGGCRRQVRERYPRTAGCGAAMSESSRLRYPCMAPRALTAGRDSIRRACLTWRSTATQAHDQRTQVAMGRNIRLIAWWAMANTTPAPVHMIRQDVATLPAQKGTRDQGMNDMPMATAPRRTVDPPNIEIPMMPPAARRSNAQPMSFTLRLRLPCAGSGYECPMIFLSRR
jgi:hypothetical protein